jgi:predicted alpha/beta superfamily hydrolase
MSSQKQTFLVALLFACTSLFAQHSFLNVSQHKLSSSVTGLDYELYVSLPKTYKQGDTTRYPVLYVLDGSFMFPVMHAMQLFLAESEETRDVIIVGIGYPASSILASMVYRTPDYTPSRDTAFEQMLSAELKMNIRSGEAGKFLQALQQEIFPLVEGKYRTGERGLAGHSFGALFGAYVLFHQPATFGKYLLSSISMPWDNGVMLKMEESFFKRNKGPLAAQVFVTVGAEEAFDMIPAMQKLTAALRARQYQGLVLEERVLPQESHSSAILTAFNHGLRVLYKK